MTREEINALLEQLQPDSDGEGFTSRELADQMGVSTLAAARRKIRRMLDEGLVEPCRVVRRGIDGVDYPVAGYRRRVMEGAATDAA